MAVVLDEFSAASSDANGGSRLGRMSSIFRRTAKVEPKPEESSNGAAPSRATTSVLDQPGRHAQARQHAELAVRLQPYPTLRVGESMSLSVRLDQLHFFDPRGQRIDVGWR